MQSFDSANTSVAQLLSESGFISHLLGAIVYLILLVLLIWRWRNRPWFGATGLVTAAMIGWNIALCVHFSSKNSLFFVHIFEILRYMAWYYLLMRVLDINFSHPADMLRKRAPRLILLSFMVAFLVFVIGIVSIPTNINFSAETGPFIRAGLNVTILFGYMMLSIIGLVLVEQVFMNTKRNSHWHIKFLCIGVATIFSYDFYVFSIAALYQALDSVVWSVRGAVDTLAMPLIAISLSRSLRWSNKLSISRQFVFRSSALLICAIYLAIVGLVGYYVGQFGGSWSTPLRIVLFAMALVVLILLVSSGRMRGLLKVLLNRHLFEGNYDYRKEWLKLTEALSSNQLEEPLPERAIHSISDLVESPGGALWLRSEHGDYEQFSVFNMPWLDNAHLAADDPCMIYLQSKERIVDLDEYRQTPDVYPGLTLPKWLDEFNLAWLLIPLILHGQLQGFMLLRHARTGNLNLDGEDYDIIRIAGRQTASFLAEMQSANALLVAEQFAAVSRTSAFIVHDLKTITAQLSLLTKNAEKHKNNPEFIDDMIKTTRHSVDKMTTLIQQLRDKQQSSTLESLDLAALIDDVVTRQEKLKPKPEFTATDATISVQANHDQLASAIGHIIQNAQEATDNEGIVKVRLKRESQTQAKIIIEDNGKGMDTQFVHNELFRPFFSTKGITGMGIGVYQSRAYLRSIGGDITVSSEPGKGSCFHLILPILDESTEKKHSD